MFAVHTRQPCLSERDKFLAEHRYQTPIFMTWLFGNGAEFFLFHRTVKSTQSHWFNSQSMISIFTETKIYTSSAVIAPKAIDWLLYLYQMQAKLTI